MVVNGRPREPCRLDDVGRATGAASHEREDLDALRIGERAPEVRQPLLGTSIPCRRVDDESRFAMLREYEPGGRLEVRDEDDAFRLRLGDVAVAVGDPLDRRERVARREHRRRALFGGVQLGRRR